jgi:hypothetical protein
LGARRSIKNFDWPKFRPVEISWRLATGTDLARRQPIGRACENISWERGASENFGRPKFQTKRPLTVASALKSQEGQKKSKNYLAYTLAGVTHILP